MVTEKNWRAEAVGWLFVRIILTFCGGGILLQVLPLRLTPQSQSFAAIIAGVIFFQGAALAWIAVFLRQAKISWRTAFSLRPPSRWRAVGAGLAAGLLVLPAMWGLQALCELIMMSMGMDATVQPAVQALQSPSLTPGQKVVFGVITIFIGPFAEEALFRGVLYPTIKQRGFPKLALWGTSIIFAVLHGNLVTLIPLILLAVVLTGLYELSGTLLTPIATHAMFNAANFFYLMFGDAISRRLHWS